MRVTSKGQVTIPRNIREALGITPETEIDFVQENDRFYLTKVSQQPNKGTLKKFRGIANTGLSTDEIMQLTREPI